MRTIFGSVFLTLLLSSPALAQTFERNYPGYRITHPRSRMSLNIPGSPTNLKGVTLYPRQYGDIEQSFFLWQREPNHRSRYLPHHSILFRKYANVGQPSCLNLDYGVQHRYATSFTCQQDHLQNWRLAPVGHGNYFMLQSANSENSNLCIEPIRNTNFIPNTPLNMQICNFRDTNQWW